MSGLCASCNLAHEEATLCRECGVFIDKTDIPYVIECYCGVVVNVYKGGWRTDWYSGEPHVHQSVEVIRKAPVVAPLRSGVVEMQ